jgi:hypothetical protein
MPTGYAPTLKAEFDALGQTRAAETLQMNFGNLTELVNILVSPVHLTSG